MNKSSKTQKTKEQRKWESYSTVEVDSGFDYANDFSNPEEYSSESTSEKTVSSKNNAINFRNISSLLKKQFKMTRKTIALFALSFVTLTFAGVAFYETYKFYIAVLDTYGVMLATVYISWTMFLVSLVALSSFAIMSLALYTKDVKRMNRVKKTLLIIMFIAVFWVFSFQWALHVQLELSTNALYIIYSLYSIASLMGLFYFVLTIDKKTDFDYIIESKASFKQTKAFDGTLVYANYNYDEGHDSENEDKVFIKKEEEKVNK